MHFVYVEIFQVGRFLKSMFTFSMLNHPHAFLVNMSYWRFSAPENHYLNKVIFKNDLKYRYLAPFNTQVSISTVTANLRIFSKRLPKLSFFLAYYKTLSSLFTERRQYNLSI